MFSQLYVDIAKMRYADILAEAEHDRLVSEALSVKRERLPGQPQPRLSLAWLSRWIPRGVRRAVAGRS
jgi:hypothetical protein